MHSIWTSSWNICYTSDGKDNLLRAGLFFSPRLMTYPVFCSLLKRGFLSLWILLQSRFIFTPKNTILRTKAAGKGTTNRDSPKALGINSKSSWSPKLLHTFRVDPVSSGWRGSTVSFLMKLKGLIRKDGMTELHFWGISSSDSLGN